jgi:hypothetical protein
MWTALGLALCAPSIAVGVAVRSPRQTAVAWGRRERPNSAPAHAIRVDRDSFWYELPSPVCVSAARFGSVCAPAGTAERVAVLLASEVADHPLDFPQPPPFDVAVRAQARANLQTGLQAMASALSYALTEQRGDGVVIELYLSAFVGERALNDAELRSLLGHELVHVYQLVQGPAASRGPELWRREIEAHEWELVHMDLGVRSWYRADALFNLDMYRRMLADE